MTLGRLTLGEQSEFQFGDSWTHLCTVGAERIDPLMQLGIVPPHIQQLVELAAACRACNH